jgi:hypothetical protein
MFGLDKERAWREDGTCSYCGSQSPGKLMELLKLPGTHFSGTDKTFYKLYVEHKEHRPRGAGKFYFSHLEELTDEELAEFDAMLRKCFGLHAYRNEKREMRFGCPRSEGFYGWQTWGEIGPDGEPVFEKGAPKPPDAAWWERVLAKTPDT